MSTGKKIAETKKARLSYALGIVNGLTKDVKEGLQNEEERREARLRRARRAAAARRRRRGEGGGEAYHGDDV